MHDALHVMFGGLKAALNCSSFRMEKETVIRDIANFLRDRSLRWRVRARCIRFTDVQTSAMFKNWSGEHIEWEYEFSERLMAPLCEVLETFIDKFDTAME